MPMKKMTHQLQALIFKIFNNSFKITNLLITNNTKYLTNNLEIKFNNNNFNLVLTL